MQPQHDLDLAEGEPVVVNRVEGRVVVEGRPRHHELGVRDVAAAVNDLLEEDFHGAGPKERSPLKIL